MPHTWDTIKEILPRDYENPDISAIALSFGRKEEFPVILKNGDGETMIRATVSMYPAAQDQRGAAVLLLNSALSANGLRLFWETATAGEPSKTFKAGDYLAADPLAHRMMSYTGGTLKEKLERLKSLIGDRRHPPAIPMSGHDIIASFAAAVLADSAEIRSDGMDNMLHARKNPLSRLFTRPKPRVYTL